MEVFCPESIPHLSAEYCRGATGDDPAPRTPVAANGMAVESRPNPKPYLQWQCVRVALESSVRGTNVPLPAVHLFDDAADAETLASACTFAVSIPIALWQPSHIDRASVLSYVPAFLPGVIAYWLFRQPLQHLLSWGVPIAIGLIATGFLLRPGWTFPAWTACLLLGLTLPLFRQISSHAVNSVTFSTGQILVWCLPEPFASACLDDAYRENLAPLCRAGRRCFRSLHTMRSSIR